MAEMVVTPQGRRFLASLLDAEQKGTRSLPANYAHPATRMRLAAHGLIAWTPPDRLKLTDEGRRLAEEETVDHG
jgi:hypothetical protein